MDDALEQRVDALERAITDGEGDLTEVAEAAEAIENLRSVEAAVEDLEERVCELEAATQALRGYVGNVRSINQDVEQRAELALSKAESLEATLRQADSIDAGPEMTDTATRSSHGERAGTALSDQHSVADSGACTGSNSGETAAEQGSVAAEGTTQPSAVPASADGGVPGRDSASSSTGRCHACGRRGPGEGAPSSDRGSTQTRLSTAGEADDTGGLVPDDDHETGRLERIRDLL